MLSIKNMLVVIVANILTTLVLKAKEKLYTFTRLNRINAAVVATIIPLSTYESFSPQSLNRKRSWLV